MPSSESSFYMELFRPHLCAKIILQALYKNIGINPECSSIIACISSDFQLTRSMFLKNNEMKICPIMKICLQVVLITPSFQMLFVERERQQIQIYRQICIHYLNAVDTHNLYKYRVQYSIFSDKYMYFLRVIFLINKKVNLPDLNKM